jgi:hypothetical protein
MPKTWSTVINQLSKTARATSEAENVVLSRRAAMAIVQEFQRLNAARRKATLDAQALRETLADMASRPGAHR